jgi:acetyl esterase/lipase
MEDVIDDFPTAAANLSDPSTEWNSVAAIQKEKDELAREMLFIPIEQYRAIGYRAPPVPADSPVPGKDLNISHRKVEVRDGSEIDIRIYTPDHCTPGSLLFFNAHGGGAFILSPMYAFYVLLTHRKKGFVTGNTETEESQNRMIAVKNRAVVVSVEYRW